MDDREELLRRSCSSKLVFAIAIALLAIAVFAMGYVCRSAFATNVGIFFTAQIEHTSNSGSTDTIECTFGIVSESQKTCEVAGGGKYDGTRAINSSTEGQIKIPSTVQHEGTTYTVVGVGDYAFGGVATSACKQLTQVELPATTTYIGDWAFANCALMANYPCPDTVTKIGDHSFYCCKGLPSKITLSAKLKTIDEYAFCGCTNLRTIEFAGDCPQIADYAFTGTGMSIKSLICNGKGPGTLKNTTFNGQSVGVPTVYYKVEFYPSQGTAQIKQNCLSTTYIAGSVKVRQVNSHLASGILDGSSAVPEWPENTNLWVLDGYSDYNSELTQATVAYPTQSDYVQLDKATLTGHDFSYTGLEADFSLSVIDTIGGALDRSDYVLSYERKNADGEWVASNDTVSEGTLRITVKPSENSFYEGQISTQLSISFDGKTEFAAPVKASYADGTEKSVNCWFGVIDIGDDGNCTVSVSEGSSYYTTESGALIYKKAIDADDASGAYVVLPDTLDVCGRKCTVTSIDGAAFGYNNQNALTGSALDIAGVEIPTAVEKVGGDAFRNCKSLAKVVFRGDARNIEWGQTVFKGASSIDTVVWMGRKADNDFLFSTSLLGREEAPTNYYTVDYYANEADYDAAVAIRKANDDAHEKQIDEESETAAATTAGDATTQAPTPVGSITISENVQLAFVGTATSLDTGLYAGSVPAFPSSYKDDGWWFAPKWMYADANIDNRVALSGTLSDSGYAYAAQDNDCYSMDGIFVKGVSDGQTFTYTGKQAFDPSQIVVASQNGRIMQKDKDYTLAYQRRSDTEEEQWVDTTDIANGGDLRLVFTGTGAYSSAKHIDVHIDAGDVKVGDKFVANLPITLPDGTQSTVECTMCALAVGEDAKVAIEPSAEAYPVPDGSDGTLSCAIAPSTKGSLDLPSKIYHNGLAMTLTSIEDSSFNGCTGLTAVGLPDTLEAIGAQAFSGCISLVSIRIPDSVTSLGNEAFCGCTSLASAYINGLTSTNTADVKKQFASCSSLVSVEMGPTNTILSDQLFYNCVELADIKLNSGIVQIGAGTFQRVKGTTEITLPASVTSLDSSAFGSSTITTVRIADGVTEIAPRLLLGNKTVKRVILPESLTTIGAYCFQNSAIETIELPGCITSVGLNAFFGCPSLSTVVFDGDPNGISTSMFTTLTNIKTVIYRREVLTSPRTVFPRSNPTYYGTVYFYDSEAKMGGSDYVGMASIKLNTALSKINASSVTVSSIAEGAIPAYPEGTNLWEFEGHPALNTSLKGGVYAYARQADYKSLADAKLVIEDGYRYSGETIDPFNGGYANVVDAGGTQLLVGEQYEVSYQRRNADGEWVATTDLTSIGGIRATVTATADSGYTGSQSVEFSIADHLVGDVFTADDVNGHAIAYLVTGIGDEVTPGTVQVGEGDQGKQAVDSSSEGAVVVPETVKDATSFQYRPTSVGDYAFYRCMGISGVVLPSSIERVGTKAFAYERLKTDTRISELATIDFGMDMSKVQIADDAFLGCDAVKTVVYRDKRGTFAAFGESSGYQVYCTARFYTSREEVGTGVPVATVVAKEGSFLHSLSATDYYEGSDKAPDVPSNSEWIYDASAQDSEGRTIDSMDVFARSLDDSLVTADIVVVSNGEQTLVPCTFKKQVDSDHEYTDEVWVGTGADGTPAVSAGVVGEVQIPSQICDSDGNVWRVAGIGAYAFGSSEAEEACKLTKVVVPASVRTIEQAAFQDCKALASVAFEDGSTLKSVGGSAFAGTSSLASVVLPEGVQTIDEAAFANSGLVRMRIPFSVSQLGKRVFSGCGSLEEVVFGGRMSLSLPAPEDASAEWKLLAAIPDPQAPYEDGDAEGSNACKLSVIDDYSFAGCTALKRVVFDSAMDSTAMSEVAFEGATGIADVVYGDLRGSFSFGTSDPSEWLTLSYFADDDARQRFDRMAAVCVKPGAMLSQLGAGDVLTGTVPEPPEHWEWANTIDTTQPIVQSAYCYARKIQYAIDVSDLDAALPMEFEVEGIKVSTAAYADVVSVSLEPLGVVQVGDWQIVDTATDDVLLSGNGSVTGSFAMPGNAVKVTAEPLLELELRVQPMGETSSNLAAQYTLQQMLDMAADSAGSDADDELQDDDPDDSDAPQPIDYTAWDKYGEVVLTRTSQYVTIEALVQTAGISFESGDSLALYSGDIYVGSLTHDDLYDVARQCYPNLSKGDGDGAYDVPAVIALRSGVASEAENGTEQCTESLADSYRVLFGQSRDEATSKLNTYSSFYGGITSITVLKGPEDISRDGFEAKGVETEYSYTGAYVEPDVSLISPTGEVLEKNVDYDVDYYDNLEPGIATVRLTGIGNYKGTIDVQFKIRRAQSISGSSREDTAAQAALDAYPDGCDGVIVATGSAFPDSLSAAPLSGKLGYPLLLTSSSTLSTATEEAISYLSSGKSFFEVLIVGGESAVSEGVEQQIEDLLPEGSVVSRLAGYDRYNTSYLLWFYGDKYGEDGLWGDTAVIANGLNFPDALSISAYSAWAGAPILLADGSDLSDELVTSLKEGGFTNVVIAGGTSVVSDNVAAQAAEVVGKANVTRLAGANRYDTSKAIAEWEILQGMTRDGAAIASGDTFPDGLSGGPAFGRSGSILLLASSGNTSALEVLGGENEDICIVRFLGGTAALPMSVRIAAMDALGWNHAMLG